MEGNREQVVESTEALSIELLSKTQLDENHGP